MDASSCATCQATECTDPRNSALSSIRPWLMRTCRRVSRSHGKSAPTTISDRTTDPNDDEYELSKRDNHGSLNLGQLSVSVDQSAPITPAPLLQKELALF